MALRLTPSGTDLLLRAIAGEADIDFTAIQFGNGADAGESASALSNPLLTAEIGSYEVGDIFVTLTSTFSNSEVSAGFRATELGVLAKDPDSSGGTLLYAYQYTPEAESDYIPASADKVLETQMDVMVYIGDADNVTASISESLVYASKAELEAHIQDASNPHEVTKEQVGLGNVPNVATNDQTPTYTMAGALTALASGERLSAAMGKLARAVSSLIAHIGSVGKNVHKETPASIGAAAASHKHSTADTTSGVLGVARGGTGVDSYEALRDKLGVAGALTIKPTQSPIPDLENNRLDNYCYGAGVFVAVASNTSSAVILRSEDGLNWQQITDGVPQDNCYGIAYGNGLFIAAFIGCVARSADGINWETVQLDVEYPLICFGRGTFLVIDSPADGYVQDQVCYTSEDGASWAQHNMPQTIRYRCCCYGNGKFAAVTDDGEVTSSGDLGATWSQLQSITGFSQTPHALTHFAGKFVLAGLDIGNGSQIAVSDDLSAWSIITTEVYAPYLTAGCGIVIAYGDSDTCLLSQDGLSWDLTDLPYQADCIMSGMGRVWLLSEDGVACSPDGQVWRTKLTQVQDLSGNVLGMLEV